MHKIYKFKGCFKAVALLVVFLATIIYQNSAVQGKSECTYLFTTPLMYVAHKSGELFKVTINISFAENLHSLQFTFTYNASLLDVENVVQGSFFPSTPESLFQFKENELFGTVDVNISLVNPAASQNGNGTLATVDFKVIRDPELCVSSPLRLEQCLLLDTTLTPITHDTVGSLFFFESMRPDPPIAGRSLDLCTQKGGIGSDVPAGEFMFGETINLTSSLEYNGCPVSNKLVASEVRDPLNESVLFRTAVTDQNGLASISFRIYENVVRIGAWRAISVAEIAEETVWDTIVFWMNVTMPVGGYSFTINSYVSEEPLTVYLSAVMILAIVLTIFRREMQNRFKRHKFICKIFIVLLFLVVLRFGVYSGLSEEGDVLVTDLYSCNRFGDPQFYFPKKTTAYFNISVRNIAQNPKNISIYLTVQDELNVPIGSDQLITIIPQNTSAYYFMSCFIPKWAYVGLATAHASLLIEGIPADSKNTELYIGPEDLTSPVIKLLSPGNATYETEPLPLVFTINERTDWVGYTLDDSENVTISGNTTLANLKNSSYKIIVYANDTSGNMGSSEEVDFTVSITHDVALVGLECSLKEAYVGQFINFTIIVQNEGTMTETFNVCLCINNTTVETQPVTDLPRNEQRILAFLWDTTNFTKGNYSIKAVIPPVLNEEDVTDNTYTSDIVNIMLAPDIAVTNVISSKTVVGEGYCASVSVTVINQGDYAETFNVTVYANTTFVCAETMILASGNNAHFVFTWQTSGFARGKYLISAHVEPIMYETDISDNNLSDGCVIVTIAGDVTSAIEGSPDFIVDLRDIGAICNEFTKTSLCPDWNPNMDINNDEIVDMKDIGYACLNYGREAT